MHKCTWYPTTFTTWQIGLKQSLIYAPFMVAWYQLMECKYTPALSKALKPNETYVYLYIYIYTYMLFHINSRIRVLNWNVTTILNYKLHSVNFMHLDILNCMFSMWPCKPEWSFCNMAFNHNNDITISNVISLKNIRRCWSTRWNILISTINTALYSPKSPIGPLKTQDCWSFCVSKGETAANSVWIVKLIWNHLVGRFGFPGKDSGFAEAVQLAILSICTEDAHCFGT